MVMMENRGPGLDSAVGYSFPLCGFSQEDWGTEEAWRFVHAQVVEFSHHVDGDCLDYVKMCWRLAKTVVVLGANGSELQLIMYFYADTQIDPCYVFVHENGIPDAMAQSLGQRYWLCWVLRLTGCTLFSIQAGLKTCPICCCSSLNV